MLCDGRKELYIQSKENENVKLVLSKILMAATKYEEKLQKDLCDFTYEEAVNFVKDLNSCSLEGLTGRMARIRAYSRWCMENGYAQVEENAWELIGRDILRNSVCEAKKDKYISREQIEEYVDELVNPCDQYILLGIYEGLAGKGHKDFLGIKATEINEDEGTIHGIKVSPKLIGIAIDSAKQDKYYSMSQKRIIVRTFREDGNIFRTTINTNKYDETDDMAIWKKLNAKVRRIRQFLEIPQMTVSLLSYSGMLTEIQQLENTSKENIVFGTKEAREIESKFGLHNISKYYLKYKANEYYLPQRKRWELEQRKLCTTRSDESASPFN